MPIRLADCDPAPERDEVIYTLCGGCGGIGLIVGAEAALHVATGVPENHGRVTRAPKHSPRKTCPRCKGLRYQALPFGLHEATQAVEYVRRYREQYGALPSQRGADE
jgi:hypothetical protein